MVTFLIIAIATLSLTCIWLLSKSRSKKSFLPATMQSLTEIPQLSKLSQEEFDLIAPHLEILELENDTCLIKEHGRDDSVYFVMKGSINIVKAGAIYQTLIKELHQGEFFGEMAFLTGACRIASAITNSKATFLRIKKNAYDNLCKVSPKLIEEIWLACEYHTISLCMADHEELRNQTTEAKDLWIAGRKTTIGGEYHHESHEYPWLAIISGQILIKSREIKSPAVIHTPTSPIEVSDHTRLCWLKPAVLNKREHSS